MSLSSIVALQNSWDTRYVSLSIEIEIEKELFDTELVYKHLISIPIW